LVTLTDSLNNLIEGTGSFSEVFKVRRITDNKVYALKKVSIEYAVFYFPNSHPSQQLANDSFEN
jgi:serine/threonine protein kinase